jgi:hypothetical protein
MFMSGAPPSARSGKFLGVISGGMRSAASLPGIRDDIATLVAAATGGGTGILSSSSISMCMEAMMPTRAACGEGPPPEIRGLRGVSSSFR